MPAVVTDEPLQLACVFSDGSSRVFTADASPNPLLMAELLSGLASLVHPHGQLNKGSSVYSYVLSLMALTRRLADAGFTGSCARLSRGQLIQVWLASTGTVESATRRVLSQLTDRLRPEVADLVAGKAFHTWVQPAPLVPYSEGEWRRLKDACRAQVSQRHRDHGQARDAAAMGADPRHAGLSFANAGWLMTRQGPLTGTAIGEHVGVSSSYVFWPKWRVTEAHSALFPGTSTVLGYRLLFACLTGIVPDGLDRLGIGDLDWAGEQNVLLSYIKGRTSAESLNLPNEAVRLLQQWLDHSALLRRFAGQARNQLWIRYLGSRTPPVSDGRIWHSAFRAWVAESGLTADDGLPFRLHLPRLRTTFLAMRDRRAWFGSPRATIDPNHSPAVEGDRYLSVGTAVQQRAVDTIIVAAQADLLAKAKQPRVLGTEDAVQAARALPSLVAELNLSASEVRQLLGGKQDVFVAACSDPLSGLHGPKGKPCPARPWVCLMCPLAVFTTRHAVNLLRLKAFFARQAGLMTVGQYMAVFGVYAQRITEVLSYFDAAVIAAAAVQVAGHDSEIPLRPEESTR